MKYIAALPILFALAACHNDNKSRTYPYQDRYNPNAGIGIPSNPTTPFNNSTTNANADKTGLISNSDDQISAYVTYRLNNWAAYNGAVPKNISNTEIADAMRYLITTDPSADEIAARYADNANLLRLAVYAINNQLNSCIGYTSTSAAACFTKWRDGFQPAFKNIADDINTHIARLSAGDADFVATDGAEIKFIVDEDGYISGATVKNGKKTTDYKHWTNITSDDDGAAMSNMVFLSEGKKLGLSYSDFGTYGIRTMSATDDDTPDVVKTENIPFAGGYASHKIETAEIADTVVFDGNAIGTARDSQHIVDLTGHATLEFDKESGTSTVWAGFTDWYSVTAKDNGDIEFSSYTNKNNLVKLTAAADDNGVIKATGAKMDVGYYAPDPAAHIPTEATGLVQYTENPSGVKIEFSFGAKK